MNEIKERPILFQGWSVRAILGGRKTQTRRLVKQVRGYRDFLTVEGDIVDIQEMLNRRPQNALFLLPHCPYGKSNDRLWVRETFCFEGTDDEPEDSHPFLIEPNEWGSLLVPHYRATEPEPHIVSQEQLRADPYDDRTRWRPSIFMPRWASRITLEILQIRIEQVQDISERDAYAEGIDLSPRMPHPIAWYRDIWNSMYGGTEYAWDVNPWVWVIEFKLIKDRP